MSCHLNIIIYIEGACVDSAYRMLANFLEWRNVVDLHE